MSKINEKYFAYSHCNYDSQCSLTKLEAFTLAAMQGMCADSMLNHERIPKLAVKIARATLAELAKEGE